MKVANSTKNQRQNKNNRYLNNNENAFTAVLPVMTDNGAEFDIPLVFVSDSWWQLRRSGTPRCLHHIVHHIDKVDMYCLNEPEGRYLALQNKNSVRSTTIRNILSGYWHIQILSNEGMIYFSFVKYLYASYLYKDANATILLIGKIQGIGLVIKKEERMTKGCQYKILFL